jgi:phage virion morphogenesis protein
MISIEIKTPEKEIQHLLDVISARMQTLKPAMQIIGETIRTSINRNFTAGGRPVPWEKSKRAASEGGQTLALSGRLKNSFSVSADNDSATVGTNVVYAAIHHFGASRGEFGTITAGVRSHVRNLASGKKVKVSAHTRRMAIPFGNIPARPFMMVQAEDWTEIKSGLIDYIAGRK